ncbi:NAD(P)-dependent oxidoreductase [Paracoccus laeviglucosivorans]|uniref:3-hydroxyisobutyrate dehydrogenase n=1 Tax=Paracoccus laeviglucosivorans TaxID=1197861 RepID=A0A521EN18_9RHOB|nr:3-hydroxyisobutyrate dehydrogenase [Paracoccus laeviglucosivorans]
MTKLGFLGFGEASFNIAAGLRDEGLAGIRAYDAAWQTEPASALIAERAAEAGVELVGSAEELIGGSDIVVCSISANAAVPVARQCAPLLRPGQVYVDLNSAGPDTKLEVEKIVGNTATFVDVAVMGTVPGARHKVPMLASGPGAQSFADFGNGFGMAITALEGPTGKASASKMFRSIFMKGYVMLLLEAVIAGRSFGIEEDVLASIGKSLKTDDFRATANDLMCRAVIHAERREHEMDEVVATLDSLDVDAIMSKAGRDKLAWCVQQGFRGHFNGRPPADFHDIFAAMDAARA